LWGVPRGAGLSPGPPGLVHGHAADDDANASTRLTAEEGPRTLPRAKARSPQDVFGLDRRIAGLLGAKKGSLSYPRPKAGLDPSESFVVRSLMTQVAPKRMCRF
jgi:hypothetical protein